MDSFIIIISATCCMYDITMTQSMRQVKISPVQYEMLVALGKRWRMKPEQLISELIEENYKNKTKR